MGYVCCARISALVVFCRFRLMLMKFAVVVDDFSESLGWRQLRVHRAILETITTAATAEGTTEQQTK